METPDWTRNKNDTVSPLIGSSEGSQCRSNATVYFRIQDTVVVWNFSVTNGVFCGVRDFIIAFNFDIVLLIMESVDRTISYPNGSSNHEIFQPAQFPISWTKFPLADEKWAKGASQEAVYPRFDLLNIVENRPQGSSAGPFSQYKCEPIGCFELSHSNFSECVSCGSVNSEFWSQDREGNSLCFYCHTRKNELSPSSGYSAPRLDASTSQRLTPTTRPPGHRPQHFSVRNGTVCSNCQTSHTSLWRRAPEGDVVCNACGLYRKLHGRQRPLTMRKDSIQTRKRRCAMTQPNESNKRRYRRLAPRQSTLEIGYDSSGNYVEPNINNEQQSAVSPVLPQRSFRSNDLRYDEMVHAVPDSWSHRSPAVSQPFQQEVSDHIPYSNHEQIGYFRFGCNDAFWNTTPSPFPQ
ncbi:hypothetical protein Aperf_G00000072560 [Anoplocephala perfoliata]